MEIERKIPHSIEKNFCFMCLFGYLNSKKISSIKELDDYMNSTFSDIIYTEKNFNCKFCFSIFSEESINQIISAVKEKGSEVENYRITTAFSPIFSLMNHYLKLLFKDNYFTDDNKEEIIKKYKYGNNYDATKDNNHTSKTNTSNSWQLDSENTFLDVATLRKVFKPLIVKRIKNELNKNNIQNSNFEINIIFDFNKDAYSKIFEAFSDLSHIKRLGINNFKFCINEKSLDRGHINEIINKTNTELFKAIIEKYNLFELLNSSLSTRINLATDSVYLKGSYIKYSREIGQSPWEIMGIKVCNSSVQDEIKNPLINFFKADDIIMHAGGREDRDVRMLGSGRPFMLEITNPKNNDVLKYLGDLNFISDIQKRVNNSTALVQIKELGSCEKGYIDIIKKFEDTKIKNYTCVVYCQRIVTDEDMALLNNVKNLPLIQKTPIRVAHRRTLMDRNKTILSLKAEKINDYFFTLDVCSSAGTYIKEFVHSDLGRTVPSVVSILGCDCDILQLDVTNIIQ